MAQQSGLVTGDEMVMDSGINRNNNNNNNNNNENIITNNSNNSNNNNETNANNNINSSISDVQDGANVDAPAVTTASKVGEDGKAQDDDDVQVIQQEEAEAERLKDEANQYFKRQDYQEAVDLYTKSISILSPSADQSSPCPSSSSSSSSTNTDTTTTTSTKGIRILAVSYANRSIAHVRMENFGYALNDANKCLELDRTYVKGYYRRAAAHMALGKYKQALKDFETVVKVCPSDVDAKRKCADCSKIVKQAAFAKAIAVDDSIIKKTIAESICLDTMAVEDSYDGPRIACTSSNKKGRADHLKPSSQQQNGPTTVTSTPRPQESDDNSDEPIVTMEFMERLLQYFKDGKRLHKRYAFQIILAAGQILKSSPSLVDITVPPESKFTICGDIHGQFFDLMNLFHINGLPSKDNPYLFNGDFVDRGSFSLECILTMFGFKILLPQHFFMARGNHESMTMNQMYGFEGEIKSKYSSLMYDLFAETFNYLPLAHCVNSRILVMHGGLFSSDDVTLDDIRATPRFRQPPDDGIMCELLWSDPMNPPGRAPSKRGVGIQFGPDVTQRFCNKNKLDYIIRSHEVKADGYEISHEGKCITVFSAPNYCDTMGNKGAIITMNGSDLKPNFITYSEVPHPDVKPMAYASSLFNFM